MFFSPAHPPPHSLTHSFLIWLTLSGHLNLSLNLALRMSLSLPCTPTKVTQLWVSNPLVKFRTLWMTHSGLSSPPDWTPMGEGTTSHLHPAISLHNEESEARQESHLFIHSLTHSFISSFHCGRVGISLLFPSPALCYCLQERTVPWTQRGERLTDSLRVSPTRSRPLKCKRLNVFKVLKPELGEDFSTFSLPFNGNMWNPQSAPCPFPAVGPYGAGNDTSLR